MSKKRTSAESNYGENRTEDSESPIQREGGNAKRAKLDPESNTTLQDLPPELLECILIKTVVMEVKGLKLAKSVWKEKADLVLSRLRPVSSLWSDVLTTNSFRTKLHRILDNTGQTFQLEILNECSIHTQSKAMITLKDEVFLLYKQRDEHYVIKVYNRNNMEEVKEVIALPGTDPRDMTGCNVSNCLYICLRQGDSYDHEILRISRDAEQKFIISPWLKDQSVCTMSFTENGGIIIYSRRGGQNPDVVRIFNADGSLQHEMILSRGINALACWPKTIIQKSNGNLILAYLSLRSRMNLLELDLSENFVRQFQSSVEYLHNTESFVEVADEHDRILIGKPFEGIELLDSEFNHLGIYSLEKPDFKLRPYSNSTRFIDLHYDRNRNEIVHIHYYFDANVITTFRFTEE